MQTGRSPISLPVYPVRPNNVSLIINDKCLKRISVNGNEFKITQFANDTTLILDGSNNTLLAALNVLEVYGNMSGLRVNMDKTN